MAPANAASDQVCMTNPLISNPLFHECCSPSKHEYLLFSTLQSLLCFLLSSAFCLTLSVSNLSSSPFSLPQPLELGYMKAGQAASGMHAGGHACLSWMPFNGWRKVQQTVLLWATQPSLGMATWVTGYMYICPHKCFQVPLEMSMATLALIRFTSCSKPILS